MAAAAGLPGAEEAYLKRRFNPRCIAYLEVEGATAFSYTGSERYMEVLGVVTASLPSRALR